MLIYPYPQDNKKLIGYEFYRINVGVYRGKEELSIILIEK